MAVAPVAHELRLRRDSRGGGDTQRRVDPRHAVQRRAEERDPGGERGDEPGSAHAPSQVATPNAQLKATDETT